MKKHICLTITAGMLLSSAYNYTQEESPKKETPGVFRRAAVFIKKRPFLIATGAVGLGLTGYFGYQHLSAASYYGSEKSPNQIVNSINPQQESSGSGIFTIVGAGIFTTVGAGIFFRKRLKNIIPKANLKLGHNYELKALQEKTARCIREKWIIFKDALKRAKKETPEEAKINAEIQALEAAEKEFLEAEKKWDISSYLDYRINWFNRLKKLKSQQSDTLRNCINYLGSMESKLRHLQNLHSKSTNFWNEKRSKLMQFNEQFHTDNEILSEKIKNHMEDIKTFGRGFETWRDVSIELNNIKYSSKKPSDHLGLVKEKLERAKTRHQIYLKRKEKHIYYENEKKRIDDNFNILKDEISQLEKKCTQGITEKYDEWKKEFEKNLPKILSEIQRIDKELLFLKTAETKFLKAESEWGISSYFYLDYQKNYYNNRLEIIHECNSQQFDAHREHILGMRKKIGDLHKVHSKTTDFWGRKRYELDRLLIQLHKDSEILSEKIKNHIKDFDKDIETFGRELETWKDSTSELKSINYRLKDSFDHLELLKEELKRAKSKHIIYLEREKKRIYYENKKKRIDDNFNTLINTLKDEIRQFEKKYNQDITKKHDEWTKEFEEILYRSSQQKRHNKTSTKKTPLENLGLNPGATKKEITEAYIRLAKIHHPDMGGNAEMFKIISNAYRAALEQATQ